MAATDDGDDAVEVGVGHGRARWKAESTIEQISGHFFYIYNLSILLHASSRTVSSFTKQKRAKFFPASSC